MSSSNSAVAEVEVEVEVEAPRKRSQTPRYHVVLWDDPEHTFDYVIDMMRELFHMTEAAARDLAETVDTQGRAICITTTFEHAELKRDQIRAFGKDPNSKRSSGSMSATIEAAR